MISEIEILEQMVQLRSNSGWIFPFSSSLNNETQIWRKIVVNGEKLEEGSKIILKPRVNQLNMVGVRKLEIYI